VADVKTAEPVRVITAVNAAIAATVGVLTITEVVSPEIGGSLALCLAAWVAVAGEILRSKVTPV
jgi:hypothetical protein